MKIFIDHHGYVLLSNLLLIISIAAIINGEYKEANYMSDLLKALKPTPIGWSNKTHHCQWKGISCSNSTSEAVISIILPSSSLTGTLPPYLNNTLTNLTHIDLHNNSLNGPLPSFSNLSLLQIVSLGNNKFSSIPERCFYEIPDLRTLNLSNNLNLNPWPWEFAMDDSNNYFPYLDTIDLEATNMMGKLDPSTFDWIPILHTLFISHNNIRGDLPESLEHSLIRYLQLNNNRFEGGIDVISSMSYLSQAWLHNNNFFGRIPNMSNCTNLSDLQLQSNGLTGFVPSSLLNLSSLKIIHLENNKLQGPMPLFHKGVKATLESNNFCRSDVGPCDPQVMTLLEIFEALEPDSIFSIKGNNACTGGQWTGISNVLFRCERGKIVTFKICNFGIMGTISPAFSKLTSLVNLTLAGNHLNGSIPNSLKTLPQLQLLDVSNNNLSGVIPNFPSKVKLNTTGNAFLVQNATTANLRPVIWIAGASMISVGFVIIVWIRCKRKRYHILLKRWIFKNTKKSIDHNVEDFIQTYNLSVPIKQYRYSEIKRITNSFRDKIGHGGYGVVYKASLPDGRQVAVKVIKESKGNGEEFINEVASISRTSHVNIVSLLGFCYENKRALIYEFVSQGSLDKFILQRGFPNAICSLDWNTMYQIAIGIARGLEYLHQGCISRILHLDIKPQNILLDANFCPKISDFGLAKICQRNDSVVSILGTRGTIGYIAPEVFSRTYGGVSHKSDVYSYGMLILEMIGGRKNYDTGGSCTSEMYFPDWIYRDLERGNNLENCLATGGSCTSEMYFPDWIYRDLERGNNLENCLANSNEENDTVRQITMVSLWCIQTKPSDRPSMSKVLEMLQGPLQSIPYPPKPFIHSPEGLSLQTSYVSSSSLLETHSTKSPKKI